jgi:2-methylisocitrate lyase-like PEP mutase family enzyme
MTADDTTRAGTRDRGAELLRLHQDRKLLTLVNVWDVITARTVAAVEGTAALATASHSIAAAFGYPDGERIPLDLHLEQIKRIVDSTDLPVTADLEGGYGDAPETVRRAIGLGVVGANIEDQLKPLPEAAEQVEAIMKVAEEEGVDFVLNARTDAFSLNRKGDPPRTSRSPSSGARPTSTRARRWSSCRRASTRTRSSPSSRRSARSG